MFQIPAAGRVCIKTGQGLQGIHRGLLLIAVEQHLADPGLFVGIASGLDQGLCSQTGSRMGM